LHMLDDLKTDIARCVARPMPSTFGFATGGFRGSGSLG
jgi:hypothetical protein